MDEKEIPKTETASPEKAEATKESNTAIGRLQKLTRRREANEIASTDFNIHAWLNYSGGRARPITREDLGNEAVVISSEVFKDFGYLTIKLPSGKLTKLEAKHFPDGDFLIIYPDDLG